MRRHRPDGSLQRELHSMMPGRPLCLLNCQQRPSSVAGNVQVARPASNSGAQRRLPGGYLQVFASVPSRCYPSLPKGVWEDRSSETVSRLRRSRASRSGGATAKSAKFVSFMYELPGSLGQDLC